MKQLKTAEPLPQPSPGAIAEEVLQHLTSQVNAKVEVVLEIHAEVPEGFSDQVVRTVTENCRTLKFKGFGFEEE